MKILKYILGVLAVLVLVFFLLGIFVPEISYQVETVADKPMAESWAVSQDPSKISEWLMGYQKTEPVSGTPGTVGAVSDIYFVQNGEEMVIRETITAIVPNESISMTFASDFMNMEYQIAMTDDNGKTKITSNTTAMGNGMVSKSIMALVSASVQEQEETNLGMLKKAIESNTKQY